MDITTFEPEMIMEVSKRWEIVESMEFPKGLKIINQWLDAGGGRAITLYGVEAIQDYMTYNFHLWTYAMLKSSRLWGLKNLKNLWRSKWKNGLASVSPHKISLP